MATVTECWDVLQTKYGSLKMLIAKRLLENELASIVRTVSGHKRNKLPKGSSQYQSLWRIADAKVEKFCSDYHLSRFEVEAQIPALKELRELAKTPAPPEYGTHLAIGLFCGTVLIFVLGIVTCVAHWLFNLGYVLIQHWLR